MVTEVNGVVYFAGKEKAITEGFFGKTVNPEIVFLFVNRAGQKYYINQENIISEEDMRNDIIPRKVF